MVNKNESTTSNHKEITKVDKNFVNLVHTKTSYKKATFLLFKTEFLGHPL